MNSQENAKKAFAGHTKSAAEACADYLRKKLVSGQMEVGASIRTEAVAHELGISHTPVREAVRRLEAEGLVIYQPRRGVRVRGLDEHEFEELVDLRKTLESLVLESPQ